MLLIIAGLLSIAWFAGVVTSYTLGGFVHLALLFAIVAVLAELVRGESRS